MKTQLQEQIAQQKRALKTFGLCAFRSWCIPSYVEVLVDAYLLEKVEVPVRDPHDPTKVLSTVTEYHPLLFSVIGKKTMIDRFFRATNNEELMIPPSKNSYVGGSNAYRVKPFYHRESPEVKRNGLTHTAVEHIPGTMEYRQMRYRPEIFQSLHSAEVLQGYMIGVDQADAEQGFPRILGESVAPYLKEKWEPSWTTELVKAIKTQDGWVTELVGHQMFGYRVAIPKSGLLALLQRLVMDGTLTISDATLKAHGIDPGLQAAV